MKIKNIGRKIIGFGQTSVLPDETAHIHDSFKDVVLDTYVALGIVSIIEPAKTRAKRKQTKAERPTRAVRTTEKVVRPKTPKLPRIPKRTKKPKPARSKRYGTT